MDDDIGSTEYWKDIRQARQEKRISNRESSTRILRESGIIFTEHNGGAHLIVEGTTCYVDFWPGTGRWICRDGLKGFGVANLLEYLRPK